MDQQYSSWHGIDIVLFILKILFLFSAVRLRLQRPYESPNFLPLVLLLISCKLKPMVSFRESIDLVFGLPLFLLPSTIPSIIVFSREPCLLMMCPKYDNLSFNISKKSLCAQDNPTNGHPLTQWVHISLDSLFTS